MYPAAARRRRRRLVWSLVVIAALIVDVLTVTGPEPAPGPVVPPSSYTDQADRSAEWVGPLRGDYTNGQMTSIVENNSYQIIPRWTQGANIRDQFDSAREIQAAAKKAGTRVNVLAYFSTAYWYTTNNDDWKPYSDGFQSSWLLHDSQGDKIPYYGVGDSPSTTKAPLAYLIDLSNPAYRQWAASTIAQWMKDAPIKGVAMDSATLMIGSKQPNFVGESRTPYNTLLCGASAARTTSDCSRVTAYNQGMASLLSQVSAALHPLGGMVLFNGIADPDGTSDSNNLSLLEHADAASNESFCYAIGAAQGGQLKLHSFASDAQVMQQAAAQNKKIFQITADASTAVHALGPYCLAGFLMGWQPGSSFWIYHQSYSDPLKAPYPQVAEQRLNLGDPTSVDYRSDGDVMTRTFQRGFVAVNTGTSSAEVTLPASLEGFSGGKSTGTYAAGTTYKLAPHGAAFFLDAAS